MVREASSPKWQTFACPSGCSGDKLLALPLPNRWLFLCMCKDCRAIWLDGPHGIALFSRDEFIRLQELRSRYVRGELSG